MIAGISMVGKNVPGIPTNFIPFMFTPFHLFQHKPELMTFWLIWSACGLVFDALFILWWVYELFVGDAIEALTNILISLLTMGEF